MNNTTGATCGVGTAYLSGVPEFTSGFSGVRVAQSLVFCVLFCLSLFVFRGVRAAQSLVFCVVFCLSLFVFRGVRAAQSLVFCVVFCRL